MERRTPVFIVCSPLPHVGKTLVARLLMEFFSADGREVAAFDVNPDNFALAEHLPRHTETASIGDIKGQMALFDQLIVADETSKVVDVGYACFEQFFAVMQEIGFEAEARRRSIAPVVLFVGDSDRRSMKPMADCRSAFPNFRWCPCSTRAPWWMCARTRSFRSKYVDIPLQIPFLTPSLKATVQRAGFSSNAAGSGTENATAELRAWIRRVFLQFRELELRLLLEELKPSLRLRA